MQREMVRPVCLFGAILYVFDVRLCVFRDRVEKMCFQQCIKYLCSCGACSSCLSVHVVLVARVSVFDVRRFHSPALTLPSTFEQTNQSPCSQACLLVPSRI